MLTQMNLNLRNGEVRSLGDEEEGSMTFMWVFLACCFLGVAMCTAWFFIARKSREKRCHDPIVAREEEDAIRETREEEDAPREASESSHIHQETSQNLINMAATDMTQLKLHENSDVVKETRTDILGMNIYDVCATPTSEQPNFKPHRSGAKNKNSKNPK
eukprot:GHVH01004631.1.p1 GENE.GHVH01004631.1~~GHVH01004631.1.p1  ORF type:complete len:160 (-),score=23.59 GHVH01004631.1:91-570(-)